MLNGRVKTTKGPERNDWLLRDRNIQWQHYQLHYAWVVCVQNLGYGAGCSAVRKPWSTWGMGPHRIRGLVRRLLPPFITKSTLLRGLTLTNWDDPPNTTPCIPGYAIHFLRPATWSFCFTSPNHWFFVSWRLKWFVFVALTAIWTVVKWMK